MRQSVIIGYPKGGGESVCLDCGDGTRLDAKFREIRSGQVPVGDYEKVQLWTRAHGRVKQYTVPRAVVAAPEPAQEEPSDEKAEIRAKLKELGVKAGPRASVETLRTQLEDALNDN